MKVFIIDDEQVSLFLTQRMLVLEGGVKGNDIHTFLSGREALSVLSSCRQADYPDALLLDLDMPEMDGWQFLDALAPAEERFLKNCSIYILTSSLNPADEERAGQNPLISGFFEKPISAENARLFSAS